MTRSYFLWIAGGLLIAATLIGSGHGAVEPTEPKVNEKLVDAASATLKATQATHEVGRASAEDVYRWSRRLMEAEQYSPQAVKEHAARMRELHKRAAAKQRVGAVGGEPATFHATEYYLAEAEAPGQ